MAFKINCYSKFNLFLKILDFCKQYKKHQIFSLFVLNQIHYDLMTISATKAQSVAINYVDANNNQLLISNCIIQKTIALFEKYYNKKIQNLKITIKKQIPLGSGLGGGSSDAANLLLFLYKKFYIPKTKQIPLLTIALKIGSDVPFFISQAKAALVSNYGDSIKPIVLNNLCYNIIINEHKCDTKVVFAKYQQLQKNNLLHYENDLMPAAFVAYPKLFKVYQSLLKQHPNVIMSGSGSAFVIINETNKE